MVSSVVEVLMGSGGYLLHAFDREGGEAAGFPKFTGGWIFADPVSGDLDGDGRPETVAVTREGYLFAWESSAPLRSEAAEPDHEVVADEVEAPRVESR